MSGLTEGFGQGLATVFVTAVLGWATLLIVLPQIAMVEKAVTRPSGELDSAAAMSLRADADTCALILSRLAAADAGSAPAASGGLAVPSLAPAAPAPSSGGMAVPNMSPGAAHTATRPYVLQCDRATTHKPLVRDGVQAWLDIEHDLPRLGVDPDTPLAEQVETARAISTLAAATATRLIGAEARSSSLTADNFRTLVRPVLIPSSEVQKAEDDARPFKQLLRLAGLRFDDGGATYERLGLVTLVRTLAFALCATALALVACYPIAYKVALATAPDRAVWLFLGLVIPYAIVELMRIYAWTTIIDNQGLLNGLLLGAGLIAEPVQFARSAMTVFVVIVYTYILFMVFPIFNVMSTLDRNQIEAARDLGAGTIRIHARIVAPHAKAGIAVGCIATFMLAAGAFSVPRIISRGLQAEWFSQTIYNKFFESAAGNAGAAYSIAYTLVCFAIVGLFMAAMRTRLKDFARAQ